MQVAQPVPLLAAVRSQLSLDSDSESCPSPAAASLSDKPTATYDSANDSPTRTANENHATVYHQNSESKAHEEECLGFVGTVLTNIQSNDSTTPTSQTLNQSTILLETSVSTNRTLEPFPEYNETSSAPSYLEDEAAYKEAFAAAVQEEIRTHEVDPFIEDAPDQSEEKQQSLEDVKVCLSDPHLRPDTRQRFIALANMVIRLEHILFRRRADFLCPQETADAQQIAVVLLGYVAWADGMIRELLEASAGVGFVLGELMREDVSEIIRYRRMACVVSAHLKKPRAPEQRLLAHFSNFFGAWVHDRFLSLRNHQLFVEEGLHMDRLQLTRHLHIIWELLTRLVQNYASYRAALNDIREKYFSSTGVSNGTIESFSEDLSVTL